MTGRLAGKTAIITGAGQGMGAAHARRFAAEGAKIVITDVQEALLRGVAEEIGDAARFIRHDVARAEDWAAVIELTESRFGRLDILVNNAAIGGAGSIESCPEGDFRRIMDVNLVGSFLGMQAVVPLMKKAGGGSIINISSAGGVMGLPDAVAYISSKFAVRGLTKAGAIDLGPYKIRVNSVLPALVRTPMLADAAVEDELLSSLIVKRLSEPEEVSGLVVYLASDESAFCTGADFAIDGGMTAQL